MHDARKYALGYLRVDIFILIKRKQQLCGGTCLRIDNIDIGISLIGDMVIYAYGPVGTVKEGKPVAQPVGGTAVQ